MLKVLIADDEQLICTMIQKMIDWNSKGLEVVGTAGNGFEVLNGIGELQPDIVITDIRMPGIDGISLIREAMKLKSSVDFIIISGYKNFEYAHQALTLGVRHYLLKPIDRTELSNSLDAIIKERMVTLESQAESRAVEEQKKSVRRQARQHFLNSILEESHLAGSSAGSEKETLEFRNTRYLAFFVKIDWTEENDVSPVLLEILKTLTDREAEDWGADYVSTQVKSGILSVINYPPGAREAHFEDMEKLYTKCRRETDKFSGYTVTFGVSSEKGDISGIRDAIDEAVCAVKCRTRKGIDRIIYFERLTYHENEISGYLTPEVKSGCRRAVEALDFEAVKSDIQLLYEQIRDEMHNSPVMIYSLTEQMEKLIEDVWKENSVDDEIIQGFSLAVETLLDRSTTEARLIQKFEDVTELFFREILEARRQSGQAPVREAKAYLAEHFRENPSLDEVAFKVGMSSAYFSSLFKKELGIGFSEYLIQLRCEEAKRLMRETNETMAAIAEAVGYQDAKYFSRIFRKTVGIKPSEYRKIYQ